jgi:hypothetical protein
MAKLLDVDPKAILDFDWQGRTGTRYRRRLRTALGIRPSTAEDFKAVENWLRQEVVLGIMTRAIFRTPYMSGIAVD